MYIFVLKTWRLQVVVGRHRGRPLQTDAGRRKIRRDLEIAPNKTYTCNPPGLVVFGVPPFYTPSGSLWELYRVPYSVT